MTKRDCDPRVRHDYALTHADVLGPFYLKGRSPSQIAGDAGAGAGLVRRVVVGAWAEDVSLGLVSRVVRGEP